MKLLICYIRKYITLIRKYKETVYKEICFRFSFPHHPTLIPIYIRLISRTVKKRQGHTMNNNELYDLRCSIRNVTTTDKGISQNLKIPKESYFQTLYKIIVYFVKKINYNDLPQSLFRSVEVTLDQSRKATLLLLYQPKI